MNRIFLLGMALVLLPAAALTAQDTRVVEYAKQLSRAYIQDGLTPRTGIGDDGVQNLAVLANNGYFPLQVVAQAGVPSVLRVYTDKTYDCSRSFYLPDLNLQANLPAKGFKEFKIPAQKKGATLFGTCGMGMYTFQIFFK